MPGTENLLSLLPDWLPLAAVGVACVSTLIAVLSAVMTLSIRRNAVKNAARLALLDQKMDEARLALDQRMGEVESSAQRQAEEAKSDAHAVKTIAEGARSEVTAIVDRLTKFEEYFRNVFEKQLSGAFRAFDQTVTDVLGHMRNELERGISRVDQMQSMIKSRGHAEKGLTESKEEVQRLLSKGELEEAVSTGQTDTDPQTPAGTEAAEEANKQSPQSNA